MAFGVVAEIFQSDNGLKLRLVNALFTNFVPCRHFGMSLAALLIEILNPVVMCTAFGKLIFLTKFVGDVGAHIVAATAFAWSFLGGTADRNARIPFGVTLSLHVELLGTHGIGQKDVGVFRRIGHNGIPYQNELAFGFIDKNVVRVVDIAMLIGQAVARIIPDKFEIALKLFSAHDAGVGCSHFMTMIDSVNPLVYRDGGFHRILRRNAANQVYGRFGFALTGVGARQANLTQQNRKHANSARGVFAVSMALRAPALAHKRSFCGNQVGRQLANGIGGNLRNGRSPLGSLFDHIVASAHNVIFVRLVLALCAFGHSVVIITDGIFVQEFFIHLAIGNPLVRNARNKRGIGSGANRQPFIGMARRSFIHAIVDIDDFATAASYGLANTREIPYGVGSTHARFRGAVAEHHHKVGIRFSLTKRTRIYRIIGAERRRRLPKRNMVAVFIKIRGAAVHIRHSSREHMRRVVVTLIYISAQKAQQTQTRLLARRGIHARCIVYIDGFIAIGLNGVLQLIGNGRNCFIPADLLKLALAALANALHRVQQAIGAIQPTTHGATAQAGACLKIVVSRIVGFHILHFAVFGMPLENTVATTVDIALAPRDGLVCFSSGAFAFLVSRRRAAEHRASTQRTCGHRSARERPLYEVSTRKATLLILAHLSPFFQVSLQARMT